MDGGEPALLLDKGKQLTMMRWVVVSLPCCMYYTEKSEFLGHFFSFLFIRRKLKFRQGGTADDVVMCFARENITR